LAAIPPDLKHPDVAITAFNTALLQAADGAEQMVGDRTNAFRVHMMDGSAMQGLAVVVPLDELFGVRLAAARRLWLGLNGRDPGADPAMPPASQRTRLTHALRALDGRLDEATYRDIAAALFGAKRIPARGWKTHDLRDRTIRLARLGAELMQGGYRQLLLYPFRQRRI
jgi:hypothetical protein